MRSAISTAVVAAVLLTAAAALAVPDGWHKKLEDGQKAARKSGKPILVVTAWKPNV